MKVEIGKQKKIELNHTARVSVGNTEKIVNIENGVIVKIESFSKKGKFYEVDKDKRTCTCPAFQMGVTRPCKHIKRVLKLK